MTADALAKLREPFPAETIGKLPKIDCGMCAKADGKVCQKHSKQKCEVCDGYLTVAHIHLDYVGHAAVTDRLLSVDPAWSWEPVAFDDQGVPLVQRNGNEARMWIRLTVCGVTRYGVGIASGFDLEKQLISDALRNAAMRFGVALDLWSKEDLTHEPAEPFDPVASKQDIHLLKAYIEELEPEQRTLFMDWKAGHDFPWPWTVAAVDAMEAKLEEIAATTPVELAGREETPDPALASVRGEVGEPGVGPGTDPVEESAASPTSPYSDDDPERPF